MPDVKEVFEMVIKQTEPDVGAWREQERHQRRRTRNRRAGGFAVAAAIALLVVAVLILNTRGQGGSVPAASPTDTPTSPGGGGASTHYYLDIATGELTPVAANLSGGRLLEISPNGERIAYGTCCTGNDFVYVRDLDGSSEPVTITPAGLNGYAPTWIDDETILFQMRNASTEKLGDLYTADVSTGELTMVVDLPDEWRGEWIVTSDVSPDGTTVLFHLPRGKDDTTWDLWSVPISGGEPTLVRESAGFATYTPDGSIVFLDHPIPFGSDKIWIMNGDGSGAREIVTVTGADVAWPRVSPDGTRVAVDHDGDALVVDIETGEVSDLGQGAEPNWVDDDTLIVD